MQNGPLIMPQVFFVIKNKPKKRTHTGEERKHGLTGHYAQIVGSFPFITTILCKIAHLNLLPLFIISAYVEIVKISLLHCTYLYFPLSSVDVDNIHCLYLSIAGASILAIFHSFSNKLENLVV